MDTVYTGRQHSSMLCRCPVSAVAEVSVCPFIHHTLLPYQNGAIWTAEHLVRQISEIQRSWRAPWTVEHLDKRSSEIPRSYRAPWTAEHLDRHSSEIPRRQNDHHYEVHRSEKFPRSPRHEFSRCRIKQNFKLMQLRSGQVILLRTEL